MYKRLRKIKFKLIILRNKVYSYIKKNKFKKVFAIISCDKYCNKIKEDVELQYYLYKNNIKADIVSWNSNIDFNKYNALIIRSIWDFQDNLDKFISWLDSIKIPIFNNANIIKNNIDKENQYNLMDKYKIKHVKTVFCDKDDINIKDIWEKNFNDYEKLVIKPSISESGKSTYLIDKNNIDSVKLDNINGKVMIQPFHDSIKNGEYSIIYFNHNLSHTVLRHSGVLDNSTKISKIDCDKDLIEICNKIESIEEFKNYLFLRLDFIKDNENYLLLEIELIDPMLFINNCENKKQIYSKFVKEIKEKLQDM